MEYITKPSVIRLARRSGVKSLSENCYPVIHEAIGDKIKEIVSTALIVNSARSTKTLMVNDIYDALILNGYNVAQSTDLGTTTCIR